MRIQNRFYLLSVPLLLACGELPETKPTTNTTEANIELSVDVVDFGELQIGSLSTETFAIRNTGDDDLIVQSISALPPFTSPSGGGFQLAPGTETSITVQFLPTTYAPVMGSLTITSNDPDQSQLVLPLQGATITDLDGDGYKNVVAGGDDCDDDDDNIHPGADDEWYDGIDSDCAGNNDYDQDGDGYETMVWNDDSRQGGGDCQDNNASMHPGAPDAWYDGVDSNCDGHDDFDQDGDGSRSLLHGRGSDCNDLDAHINTSGIEAINGLDDDCDGNVDMPVPAWNTDKLILGTAANDRTGWTLTTGDMDGDNRTDILVGLSGYQGNKGGVAVLTQTSIPAISQSSIANAYNIFPGSLANDAAGSALSFLGDFGSGGPSLAVGAPGVSSNSGRVYLIEGDEVVYGGDLDDAYLTITGQASSYFGDGLTQDVDLDGDGFSDLFGHYRSSSNNYFWLLYGDSVLTGAVTNSDMDLQLSSTGTHANAWRHMPSTGDLDGDGLDDIIRCDHRYTSTTGGYLASEANVLWGNTVRYSSSGTLPIGSVTTTIFSATGSSSSNGDGYMLHGACGIMPDWNGDGMDEFWTFITQSDDNFTGIYVFNGNADWKQNGADLNPNEDASYFIMVPSSGPPVSTFRPMGDWDHDGISEVGIGFGAASSGSSAGKVWMLSSQLAPGMNYNQNNLAALVVGDDEYFQARYGNVLSIVPGDLNRDGKKDWLVSDWGYLGSAGGSTNQGALYITYQR